MKYDRCPVPTSLVRSSSLAIATYETCAFLPHKAYRDEEVYLPAPESSRGKPLIPGLVATGLVVAAFLLAVAAAQAEPVNLGNQATLVRFTDKVAFGVVRRARVQDVVDSAFARLPAIQNRNFFKARQQSSTDAKTQFRHEAGPLPSIVQAHL